MAIVEHMSPLVVARKHRPAGHTLAVAAPLLVLLALLAAFSGSPVAAAEDSSPVLIDLTLVAGAQEKGAVCLDGTPPAYHLQRGFGSGSQSWIVFLQGGAWCGTTGKESCSIRKMTEYGSSKFMKPIAFDGVLSDQQPQNPDFYNWNKVFVRYCDGASFSGDAEGEAENGTKLYFRGLRIWEAVVDELMEKGMDTAKQALLAGCSAGGLSTLLHCDNFRGRFPQEVSVKCLPDAGFFLDA